MSAEQKQQNAAELCVCCASPIGECCLPAWSLELLSYCAAACSVRSVHFFYVQRERKNSLHICTACKLWNSNRTKGHEKYLNGVEKLKQSNGELGTGNWELSVNGGN